MQSGSNEDPSIIDPEWLFEESDQEIAIGAYRRDSGHGREYLRVYVLGKKCY